jgi:hypothetical protein
MDTAVNLVVAPQVLFAGWWLGRLGSTEHGMSAVIRHEHPAVSSTRQRPAVRKASREIR